MVYFNPRTHEGYDKIIPFCFGITIDFNPRTHEGYDCSSVNAYCESFISIHVPTKGTTWDKRMWNDRGEISIHVPTKGTTTVPQLFGNFYFISIHVPTKGTTAKIYNNIPSFLLIFIYFPIFSYQNIKSTLFKNNYWYFFQCESLCIFLSASYSHLQNTQVQHLSAFFYELWQTFQLLH